jgi:hypothetical protein
MAPWFCRMVCAAALTWNWTKQTFEPSHMQPTKPKLLINVMSPELLAYKKRKIHETKIPVTPKTEPLEPKKQDLAHLDNAVINLPTANPIL